MNDILQKNSLTERSTFWLTRFVILRLLGIVYAVAFLVAANQILPLVGSHGLLPTGLFLDQTAHYFGTPASAFLRLPSLFWLAHSDATLVTTAWIGFALSLVVVAGYANALLLAVLWFTYMSFIHIGQDWYGFGWETQLLETGFLAIFLCPLWDARPFSKRPPPVAIIWLFRWLIFRIMLGAGLIKLRGDPAWRDLTALDYHFLTQPLPNPLSRWFYFLPKPFLRMGVLFNHVSELVAPWFVFWPRRASIAAGALIILFQFALIVGGNLSFLNWLTIIPALACFDDAVWSKILPRSLIQKAKAAEEVQQPGERMNTLGWSLAAIIAFLSIPAVMNMVSPNQVMNESFDPLHIVNTYGAFGSVGRERTTVVFEGTSEETLNAKTVWTPYLYKALPVKLDRMPPQIAPYQLRLDWQMWFAGMSNVEEYPWTLHLVWKLLHNDPGILSLFDGNPFPEKPPSYVRAMLYRYKFAKPGNPHGDWWEREELGQWLPPFSIQSTELRENLQNAGWLSSSAKP
ncbi:MAG: lipase maturation factor family protein [Chthoniobacterales bacterium]